MTFFSSETLVYEIPSEKNVGHFLKIRDVEEPLLLFGNIMHCVSHVIAIHQSSSKSLKCQVSRLDCLIFFVYLTHLS